MIPSGFRSVLNNFPCAFLFLARCLFSLLPPLLLLSFDLDVDFSVISYQGDLFGFGFVFFLKTKKPRKTKQNSQGSQQTRTLHQIATCTVAGPTLVRHERNIVIWKMVTTFQKQFSKLEKEPISFPLSLRWMNRFSNTVNDGGKGSRGRVVCGKQVRARITMQVRLSILPEILFSCRQGLL